MRCGACTWPAGLPSVKGPLGFSSGASEACTSAHSSVRPAGYRSLLSQSEGKAEPLGKGEKVW